MKLSKLILSTLIPMGIAGTAISQTKAAATPSKKGPSKEVTHEVSLKMNVNGKSAGNIVIDLWGETAPATSLNFLAMCEDDVTLGGKKKPFKGVSFHRIIADFMMQGGDFTNGNGTGGVSIYGDKFSDENFLLKHTESGLLSMANAGPNTNGSQFFITYKPTAWLDNKHVVFGKVQGKTDEKTHLIRKIETETKTNRNAKIMVEDCSVKMKKKLKLPPVYKKKISGDLLKALSKHIDS